MADVRISEPALEALNGLPPDDRERIKRELLDEVAGDPDRYIKPPTGEPHGRVRVGDYRVIVEHDRDAGELRIHDFGHRRNIYD